MARTAGGLYAAGGVAAMAVIAGLGTDLTGPAVILWIEAVTAVVIGALLWWRGRLLPRWAFHVVVAAGTLLITFAVWVCPSPVAAVVLATLCTFIAVDAFFFFTWPPALAHLTGMVVLQASALVSHPTIGPGVVVALAAVCAAIAAAVGHLAQHAASASRDSLTGLLNRRGFDDALEAALSLADWQGQPLSMALVDVDRFKAVNDGGGHRAGDDLLQRIAAECSAALPAEALLARHGGDEFAVLLPGITGGKAIEVVEAMRTAVTASISCGVAQHLSGKSGADLLRRADSALYAAKAAGRGRSSLSGTDNVDLAHDLARAIAHDDLRVVFQPILALPEEDVVGVEALVRWTHPERGPVPPADFIPTAEVTGLIVDLGAAVLAQACRGAATLQQAWGQQLVLSVNASGRELSEPGYADAVQRILHTTGWPAASLIIEVTESLLEATSNEALQTLIDLRAAGVAVAIDDFGTGYSAFSRLDTLPADYLKLDSTFISTITRSFRRAGMLRALLALSRSLGLIVIAEGVETADQALMLRELGCPMVQGYLYRAPQSIKELTTSSLAGRPHTGTPLR